jgi:hypothetical protein
VLSGVHSAGLIRKSVTHSKLPCSTKDRGGDIRLLARYRANFREAVVSKAVHKQRLLDNPLVVRNIWSTLSQTTGSVANKNADSGAVVEE